MWCCDTSGRDEHREYYKKEVHKVKACHGLKLMVSLGFFFSLGLVSLSIGGWRKQKKKKKEVKLAPSYRYGTHK